MRLVVLRQAADAVFGKKFRRAQKPLQYAPHLLVVHNGEFVLLLSIAFQVMAATFGEPPAVVDEPQKVGLELLKRLQVVHAEGFRRIKRDYADQRAHPELLEASVWISEHIVEEAVVLVPE